MLLTTAAHAQSVRWEPSEAGMPNAVMLIFENCEPDGQPELPTLPGVTFTFLGRSESSQSTFGTGGFTTTRSVALSYMVRARQNSPVQIPSFNVKTNKGPLRVAPFNAAAPAAPLETVAHAKLTPERTSVWAGEVFGLTYELSASRRTNPQISPTFDWNAAPLVAEDWSKPEVTEAVTSGERRVNVTFRTRAVSKSPATLKLEPAVHLLSIQTGTIGFGIISQPRMEQVSVTSDQPTIEVRPLPTAPAGFSGAVGQFKLISKVVPDKAAVGEPVTWTLELNGTGNWPDIAGLPARDVSNDFQVVQPKAKRTPAEGKLFDATLAEDVVLVPTKAGSYALGPVNFTYFDPKSATYKTITAPRTSIAITAPHAPQFNMGGQPTTTETAPQPVAKSKPATAAPSAPTGIPRDPLPGSAEARVPMTARTLVVCLVAPAIGLIAFWLCLAVQRAKQTDPVRTRREARDRLAKTLSHLPSASHRDRATLLLAWQRDTTVLWEIPHAAPSASVFLQGRVGAPRSSNPRDDGADRSLWATLWQEADRVLYGANIALPSDWVARARKALAAKRLPGFKPMRLFLPQNLMPFAAMIAVLFLSTAVWVRAAEADALDAYNKGDFAASEKAWRATIKRTPTNWIARHNLSLALEQQERASEGLAQAAAAFVQQPGNAAVRWHFAHAVEKGGVTPRIVGSFVAPGPLQSLGRITSPGNWQLTLIVAAWGAAAAVGWMLINAYRDSRRRRWGALVLLLGFLGLGASAIAGVYSYGLTANPEAVIVGRASTLRSVPTEADTTQKTSPLAAGSIALANKTFLTWTRLKFETGQTGWVRQDDIVPLWK